MGDDLELHIIFVVIQYYLENIFEMENNDTDTDTYHHIDTRTDTHIDI